MGVTCLVSGDLHFGSFRVTFRCVTSQTWAYVMCLPRFNTSIWIVLKVDGVLNGYFSQQAHLSGHVKHPISVRWLANPNRGCRHFPRDFWSSFEYLMHCWGEGSHAPRSFLIMSIFQVRNYRVLSMRFDLVNNKHIFLEFGLGTSLNHIPLKYWHIYLISYVQEVHQHSSSMLWRFLMDPKTHYNMVGIVM